MIINKNIDYFMLKNEILEINLNNRKNIEFLMIFIFLIFVWLNFNFFV